jgi:Flp pilus assembly protein TadD
VNALAALVLVVAACSSSPARSPCTAAEVAAIEREVQAVENDMFAEGLERCYGRELEQCGEFPEVRAKYRDRRQAAHRAKAACQ